MTYDAGGRCVEYDSRRTVFVDFAGHKFDERVHYRFAYETTSSSSGYVSAVTVTDDTSTRRITYDAAGYEIDSAFGVGTPLEQHTTYVRDAQTRQATHISVSCGAGGHARTVTDAVTLGQNTTAIVDRARIECDRQMLSASR